MLTGWPRFALDGLGGVVFPGRPRSWCTDYLDRSVPGPFRNRYGLFMAQAVSDGRAPKGSNVESVSDPAQTADSRKIDHSYEPIHRVLMSAGTVSGRGSRARVSLIL